MTTFRSVPLDVVADGTVFDHCGHRRTNGQLICLLCSPLPHTDIPGPMTIETRTVFGDWEQVATTTLPKLARLIEDTLTAEGIPTRIV